jgi:hypothetical protein
MDYAIELINKKLAAAKSRPPQLAFVASPNGNVDTDTDSDNEELVKSAQLAKDQLKLELKIKNVAVAMDLKVS